MWCGKRVWETYAVVMLDGFRDEGVDEERDFLFCWWHFSFFFLSLFSLLLGLVGFLVVVESWIIVVE